MIPRLVLAIAIGVWTLLAWGGRVRLLTDSEQADPANWLRIGGSILIGAVAVLVIVLAEGGSMERWVLTLFAAWSAVLWVRSLVIVWSGDQTMTFKVVHSVLAAGFLSLAYLAARTGWSPRS